MSSRIALDMELLSINVVSTVTCRMEIEIEIYISVLLPCKIVFGARFIYDDWQLGIGIMEAVDARAPPSPWS